jgi:homocysteine S-methyltransferase
MADNPCALAKGDSVTLSALLALKAGVRIMPHIACRDRNLLALKSAMMALDIAGLREILIVTGDPIRDGERGDGMMFSGLSSERLIEHVSGWNADSFFAPLEISAALNVNAVNFEAELRKAERKIKAGARRFLTQPLLSERAVDNLAQAPKRLNAEILGGLLPIVSEGNADFLARGEISGIRLDPWIRSRYKGKEKEEASELALEISLGFARKARPFVDGYYVITPFRRVDIVDHLVRSLKGEDPGSTQDAPSPHALCLD